MSEEVFISYLNDDGETINGFVELISIGRFVKFSTKDNIVWIPSDRVLKIKKRIK